MLPYIYITGTSWLSELCCPLNQSDHHSWPPLIQTWGVKGQAPVWILGRLYPHHSWMRAGWAILFVNVFMLLTEMLLVLYCIRPWTLHIKSYDLPIVITLISAIYIQVACLCLLLVIRFVVIVIQAVDKPSGVVTKPFDFYAMTKDSNKPAIYTMVSGVTLRCVNSVLWIFTRFNICTAMIGIGLSSFSDVSSSLPLRWPSSHSRSPTLCLDLLKRQVRCLRKYIPHQCWATQLLLMGIGVSLL